MSELLKGDKLVLHDGSKVSAEQHLKNKLTALYFSAGWCPPCRQFTPKLKRFYEALIEAGKPFEVIFVSRDREAEDLVEYYEEKMGKWTYLAFGDPKIQELLAKYEIKTIPALKVIQANGEVIAGDARNDVQDRGQDDPVALFDEWEKAVRAHI